MTVSTSHTPPQTNPTSRTTGKIVHPSDTFVTRRSRLRVLRAPRAPAYNRAQDLPRLLPMWPKEVQDSSLDGRERVIATLKRALKAERQRGLAGHWTYDLARHAQLLSAYRTECAECTMLRAAHRSGRPGNAMVMFTRP
jgi:hypothetical protein